LPKPELPVLDTPFDLLVTGVGGTGVVTIGALITMAAHLEGKGASVLDFTGFAQKFGSVISYRANWPPAVLTQPGANRCGRGRCADRLRRGRVILAERRPPLTARGTCAWRSMSPSMPTGDLVLKRDARSQCRRAASDDCRRCRRWQALRPYRRQCRFAEALFGDAVFANMMMLGFAWQRGTCSSLDWMPCRGRSSSTMSPSRPTRWRLPAGG
jgi:indolepyruvate ferredoxin oxidoreductase